MQTALDDDQYNRERERERERERALYSQPRIDSGTPAPVVDKEAAAHHSEPKA